MKLVIISAPHPVTREEELVRGMLKAGLTHFHLRRPTWQKSDFQNALLGYTKQERKNIVLHSQHDLVPELGLKARHFTSSSRPELPLQVDPLHPSSASLHSLQEVQQDLRGFDYVFLSPIFDSISKEGYKAVFKLEELRKALPALCPVIALGGITTENCAIARDLGFDGVAVLGSVWRSPDPVAKCKEFLSICSRLAGPKERLKSLSDTEVSFRS